MTQFFGDSDNGLDSNDGLSTGASFKTANKFTETARSAGDRIKWARGRTARIDDGGLLDFTSDGTFADPIVMEADFDNAFGDDVTTAGETYTTTFGSKVIVASAMPDAAIVAGVWVYVSGDDAREFAYEVDSVSVNDITLFKPFKGTTGSGLTLVVMKADPIWGATSSFAFDVNLAADNFWYLQGIEWRTSSSTSLFDVSGVVGLVIKDCICKGTSTTEIFDAGSGSAILPVLKTRCFEYEAVVDSQTGTNWHFKDCLFDGNNVAASSEAISLRNNVVYEECEFKNHTVSDIIGSTSVLGAIRYLRNCKLDSTTEFSTVGNRASPGLQIYIEDYDGDPGVTVQHSGSSPSNTVFS